MTVFLGHDLPSDGSQTNRFSQSKTRLWKFTATETGTVEELTISIVDVGDAMRVMVYEDTVLDDGALLGQSAVFNTVNGDNTVSLETPVSVVRGHRYFVAAVTNTYTSNYTISTITESVLTEGTASGTAAPNDPLTSITGSSGAAPRFFASGTATPADTNDALGSAVDADPIGSRSVAQNALYLLQSGTYTATGSDAITVIKFTASAGSGETSVTEVCVVRTDTNEIVHVVPFNLKYYNGSTPATQQAREVNLPLVSGVEYALAVGCSSVGTTYYRHGVGSSIACSLSAGYTVGSVVTTTGSTLSYIPMVSADVMSGAAPPASGLTIDSTDASMQRNTNFQVVGSGATTTPTILNSKLVHIPTSVELIPSSVVEAPVGTFTWTFPVGDVALQVDATGYDWTLEITP